MCPDGETSERVAFAIQDITMPRDKREQGGEGIALDPAEPMFTLQAGFQHGGAVAERELLEMVDSQQPMLSREVFPARMSVSPGSVRAWLEAAPASGASSVVSWLSCAPPGLLSRTSLAFYPAPGAATSQPSFPGWGNSGMAWPGGCLTLNGSEWPNGAAVCSLSAILETGGHLSRFLISPKAARGILHRAEKRGKALPPPLRHALEAAASQDRTTPPTDA